MNEEADIERTFNILKRLDFEAIKVVLHSQNAFMCARYHVDGSIWGELYLPHRNDDECNQVCMKSGWTKKEFEDEYAHRHIQQFR